MSTSLTFQQKDAQHPWNQEHLLWVLCVEQSEHVPKPIREVPGTSVEVTITEKRNTLSDCPEASSCVQSQGHCSRNETKTNRFSETEIIEQKHTTLEACIAAKLSDKEVKLAMEIGGGSLLTIGVRRPAHELKKSQTFLVSRKCPALPTSPQICGVCLSQCAGKTLQWKTWCEIAPCARKPSMLRQCLAMFFVKKQNPGFWASYGRITHLDTPWVQRTGWMLKSPWWLQAKFPHSGRYFDALVAFRTLDALLDANRTL